MHTIGYRLKKGINKMTYKNKKKILAVGAHADDVEIGCGGTLAHHIEKGDDVYVVVMAESSYTNYDGTVLRSSEEAKNEELNAAEILNIKIINLGFETKSVPYSSESIERLNSIIDQNKIEILYTHWYHDTHQDHRRTTQSVLSAGRRVQNILMYEPEYPAGRSYIGFRNQYYVDISQVFQLKMKALMQHKSQIQKFGGNYFMDAVKARAINRGYEIGSKYAECFEIIRLLKDD